MIAFGGNVPTHVVVDTADGYTFNNDGNGLMDKEHALRFAEKLNGERKPAFRTFHVYELVMVK